jgi:signal-transduction protein with cAMP-binding, CBS, and nucleotidyltransferase domain
MDANQRTVGDLRPKKNINIEMSASVAAAARKMLERNTDAALIVSAEGDLLGILTDSDVTPAGFEPALSQPRHLEPLVTMLSASAPASQVHMLLAKLQFH